MKLARVLAKHPGKLADTVKPPSDTAATNLSSAEQRCKDRASVSGRTASESAGSSGREECWSCGVCYEHVCCPFTLPCGHTICGSCLEQLLMRQATCPFCRVSVFQSCTFGRNVSMWNYIQARHPKEAAQLSNKSTVIRYDPSSPPPPHPSEEHQHPQYATESLTGSTLVAGTRTNAFVATYLEPVLPIGRTSQAGHVVAPPASQRTSIGRNILSRLAGLATLALQAPQAAPRNSSEATEFVTSAEVLSAIGPLSTSAAMSLPMIPAGYRLATRTTVRSTDRASRHVHVAATSDGHATLVQPEAELSHRVSNQPEVLRRAQAAFSDLRETGGRGQAQLVF